MKDKKQKTEVKKGTESACCGATAKPQGTPTAAKPTAGKPEQPKR